MVDHPFDADVDASLRVKGSIDRVDIVGAGAEARAVVIGFKTHLLK